MKGIIFFIILILSTELLFSQENKKGDLFIGASLGPSVSNLINSEAPHKIHIWGSNPAPYPTTLDKDKSPAYHDYETSILKDLLFRATAGVQIEYFISDKISVNSGLNFEMKGINLNYSNARVGTYVYDENISPGIVIGEINENVRIEINNNYITFPILVRKYFGNGTGNFFLEGGAYGGYLISSKIDYLYKVVVDVDDSDADFESSSWIHDQKDKQQEFTNKFDYGFSLGTGCKKYLTDRLVLNYKLLLNVGLRKVDAKYNNEYSATPIPDGSSFSNTYLVYSTNYYRLNSNSKNITMLFKIGIEYKFDK